MTPKNRTKSTRSSRSVMLAVLVLIGAAAGYNWLVAPHCSYLRAAQKGRSTAGELVRKDRLISNDIAAHKELLTQLQEKFIRAKEQFFDPAGASEFFGSIDALAQDSGCILSSLIFRPAKLQVAQNLSGFITPRHATLSVLANYAGLVTMLNKLQDRPEQVRVDSIDVKLSRNTPGRLNCDMNITIHVVQDEEALIDD